MDLNKDNRNVYTVDAESYSEYMHDNWEKPTDFLSSFIKILLVILLLVIAYFSYRIIKDDLSFSEVFNKKELLSAYSLFDSDEKSKEIVKEDYVEVLAQSTTTDLEQPKKIPLIKKEEVEVEKIEAIVLDKVVEVEQLSALKEEVKSIEPIEQITEKIEVKPVEVEVQKEIIVEEVIADVVKVETIEVKTLEEKQQSNILTESYLDRMVEELSSL